MVGADGADGVFDQRAVPALPCGGSHRELPACGGTAGVSQRELAPSGAALLNGIGSGQRPLAHIWSSNGCTGLGTGPTEALPPPFGRFHGVGSVNGLPPPPGVLPGFWPRA